MPDPRAADAPASSRFRDLHARTHEIELLFSGALVFGLLHAPRAIERAFERSTPRLDGLSLSAATYLYLYAELLAYSLLFTFIIHLLLRGHWAALLGLESVWPRGWDWDRLKLGPYLRRNLERRIGPLASAIDGADDRASAVFAVGALLAMIFLYSILLVLAAMTGGLGISLLSGGRVPRAQGFFGMLVLLAATSVVLPLLDRFLGARLSPHSRSGRVFDHLIRWVLVISPLRWTGPIQFVFQSRFGERKITLALVAAMVSLVGVLVSGFLFRSDGVRVDGWRYFEAGPAAGHFDPRHYRASGRAVDGLRPTIDDEIIVGPYLRLYLPYRPRRHNGRIATSCPDLDSMASETARRRNARAAACVGGLYRLRLDGEPLGGLTFDFTRDAASGFVGVMTFLSATALASGRHELSIEGPGREDAETEVVLIPFYRG